MKQFMDFMRKSYQHYYLIDERQNWIPSDRCTVFAPSYNKNQRWLWDDEDEHSFVVRLPLTDWGLQKGNEHLASIKRKKRGQIAENDCVGFANKRCRKTCDDCQYQETCTSKSRQTNGFSCHGKCEICSSYIGRTSHLDAQSNAESDGEEPVSRFELDSGIDIEAEHEHGELLDTLYAFLDLLTAEERLLWDCLKAKEKKVDVSKKLGITVDGVRYREMKLYAKVKADKRLKSFFEKD